MGPNDSSSKHNKRWFNDEHDDGTPITDEEIAQAKQAERARLAAEDQAYRANTARWDQQYGPVPPAPNLPPRPGDYDGLQSLEYILRHGGELPGRGGVSGGVTVPVPFSKGARAAWHHASDEEYRQAFVARAQADPSGGEADFLRLHGGQLPDWFGRTSGGRAQQPQQHPYTPQMPQQGPDSFLLDQGTRFVVNPWAGEIRPAQPGEAGVSYEEAVETAKAIIRRKNGGY